MPEITKEQRKEYISSGWGKCPFCKSKDTEGYSIDIDGNHAHQECNCLTCNSLWVDIYTLSDVEIG
ncbi:MAG: hypothetical protein WC359_12920 [Dehalococcoidia bacterium]